MERGVAAATVREFGAVGNGLSYALGIAAARRQGREGVSSS
jgi:hypothetical protein